MPIHNRLRLIRGYFSANRDFPIDPIEVIAKGVLKKTCLQIGPGYVERIENDGEFERVWVRGIPTPLYWPKNLDHFDLYKSCTDCLHDSDWHHYEVPETRVQPGDVVLDCGAAEGMFALSVLDRAGHVAVFEPWSGFRESLLRTFGSSGNVSVVQAALGARVGSAFLDGGSLYGTVSTQTGDPIPVTTVDAWRSQFGKPLNYIKGDLESSEYEMLLGARESIAESKPRIAITVYHPNNDWQEMWKLLKSLVPSYRCRIKGLSYNAGHPRPVMLHVW